MPIIPIFLYFCNQMKLHLSDELSAIFSFTREEALRTACPEVQTGHFLLGIIRHKDNPPFHILTEAGADPAQIKSVVQSALKGGIPIRYDEDIEIPLSREAQNCFSLAVFEATSHKQSEVSSAHLLLALTKSSCPICTRVFSDLGLTHDSLASEFSKAGLLSPDTQAISAEEIANFFQIKQEKHITS